MLLETTNSVWNYVLIAVVVLLLIAMPIMMNQRNKRESQKIQEQTNSLKIGDKVLTTSGVYGTITELKFDDSKKVVVIETGGKTKSYMSVDAYSIYTVFKSDAEIAQEAALKADAESKQTETLEKKEAEKAPKKAKVEEKTEAKTEEKTETKAESSEKPKKRASKKSTETKAE
jgi:preprotein translocase subunit YajC